MTAAVSSPEHEDLRDRLQRAMRRLHLRGLWQEPAPATTAAPTPVTRAWHWRASDVLPLARLAGTAVALDSGEHHALQLVNPALSPTPYTTTTVQGAVQCLGGRQTLPARRHTPSVVRFVLQGSGSYTTVGESKCHMAAGDFMLTPDWSWHDHTNPGDEDVVWFDGLDFPTATRLECAASEVHFAGTRARNASKQFHQPWEVTDRALGARFDISPKALASVQFSDPDTGGSICPTFDAWMHRMGPALDAAPTRKTGHSIFVVFDGSGATDVGSERFAWGPGDIFVAPSWATVQHHPAAVSNLFELSDRPILQALRLFHEETVS